LIAQHLVIVTRVWAVSDRLRSNMSMKPHKRSGWLGLGDRVFPHVQRIGTISGILAFLAVLLVVLANALPDTTGVQLGVKLLSAAWAVLPPVYFFFEYHWARETPWMSSDDRKNLQESQQMAQPIWAAMVLILGAIYLKGATG
jgi:hypothetical protein